MFELSLLFIMVVVGVLHGIWALKIWWPIPDEQQLAKTVVGIKGIERMPSPLLTWLVTFVIFFGGYLIATLSGWVPMFLPEKITVVFGWIMGVVLVVRAVYPYLGDKYLTQEPQFRTLNLRFYSPIIFYLGVGTISLVI